MFSGIKSILFGYTESEAKKDDTNEFALPNESSFSHDTSVLLEQTLNSATTKFTEQLLPQSPSIEQLQSSSHQLLPTLIEQHEEDEKKKKEIESEDGSKLEDDDDDDCFNADSWELLDLVEKQEADSLDSTVQEELVISKASGILKQKNKTISHNKCQNSSKTQRQKQKVSFETPNLVKDKQKIEPIVVKEKIKSNSKSTKKNKKKSKIEGIASSNEIVDVKVEKPSLLVQPEKLEVKDKVVIKSIPVLNYAAALTKKQNVEKVDISTKRSAVLAENSGVNLIASLPTKRNRPVSTSSWSSNDEAEAVASNWNNDKVSEINEKDLQTNKNDPIKDTFDNFANDDKDSIISSGFSDCDYGYGGLNDYIMRPKKSQNKKRRGLSSIYCSINNSVPKRGQEQVAAQRKASLTGGSQERQELPKSSSLTSSKHIKPRKKKMILSIPSNSSEFLKKRTFINCGQAPASTSFLVAPIAAPSVSTTSSCLMPPPLPLQNIASSSTSGNDSSDIADMDESWYVTPPPCFTGTNKLDRTSKPKAKEADRENALIEHPSIYIASTSTNKASKENSSSKQMSIVLKKINHKQSIVSHPAKVEQNRKCVVSPTRPEKKRDAKAWENKFIVTNWAYDDQDDLKDDFFDNLFEVEEQVVHAPKPKATKTKKQVKSLAERTESPCLLEMSAEYESDFSNTPALIGTTDNLIGDELLYVLTDDMILISQDENARPVVVSEASIKRRNKMSERRAPLQVAPIEPERQPGWQLRRKRSRRRPLTVSMANTCSAAGGIKNPVGKMIISQEVGQQISADISSNNSSARSTPSLIDRIGSSIVANLTTLTSGFPNGAIPIQAQRAAIEEVEKLNQVAIRKSNSELNLLARRRMSKAYLDRQNDCARLANSNRRADRRLKMHSTPNGSSVNRKVHASFH